MVIRSLSTPSLQQLTIKVSRISSEVVMFGSFLEQKHAIWSLCVVCIVWSALILYIYTDWWVVNLQLWAFFRNVGFKPNIVDGYFLAKGVEMVYTQGEKTTLVFCTFVIICSVIEIVLAAAMMKICKTTTTTPQLSSSSSGYYQVLFSQ